MDHTRARRIPTEPRRILDSTGDLLKHSSNLIRLSGLMAVVGGVLWVTQLILMQLQVLYLVQFYTVDVYNNPDCADCRSPFHQGNSGYVLAIPMLLLLVGLIGLYLQAGHRLYQGWWAKTGISLLIVGVAWAIAHASGHSFGDHQLYWFGGYGGLIGYPSPPLTMLWYGSLGPGFIVFSIGLVLLVNAYAKHRVLSNRIAVAFTVSSLVMNIFAWVQHLVLSSYRYANDVPQYHYMLFTLLFVVFGLCWIWLGADLWKRGSKQSLSRRIIRE